MAFVQGFLAKLILDSIDITLVITNLDLGRSKTSLDKSVMDGSGESTALPGMTKGTLSFDAHVDQANQNLLEVAFAKQVPVPFVLTVLEGLTTDAEWTGTVALTGMDVSTSFDGNWDVSLSGDTSGAIVYTPSAP